MIPKDGIIHVGPERTVEVVAFWFGFIMLCVDVDFVSLCEDGVEVFFPEGEGA